MRAVGQGRPPFGGETPLHVLIAHQQQSVPPLCVPGREIPDDLESVITRCLEKDRDERYKDAIDLERAVAACRCSGRWTEADADRWWNEHPLQAFSSGPLIRTDSLAASDPHRKRRPAGGGLLSE